MQRRISVADSQTQSNMAPNDSGFEATSLAARQAKDVEVPTASTWAETFNKLNNESSQLSRDAGLRMLDRLEEREVREEVNG